MLNMCFNIPIAPADAASTVAVDDTNDRVTIVETITCVSVAVFSVLVLTSHIVWNAQNDWVWKFI